jgi:hypothetical protein
MNAQYAAMSRVEIYTIARALGTMLATASTQREKGEPNLLLGALHCMCHIQRHVVSAG